MTDNVNTLKKSRPFQTVEKICSALMAILFLLFNALYWPWLLREGDFDYEKFEKAVTTLSQQPSVQITFLEIWKVIMMSCYED